MKKIKIIILCFILLLLPSCKNKNVDNNYSSFFMKHYFKDNEVVNLAEIYPYRWDYIEIISSPNAANFNLDALLDFEPSYKPFNIIEQLLIFYKNSTIVGFTSFNPTGADSPNFVSILETDNIAWKQTYSYDDAIFRCSIENGMNNFLPIN